MLHRGGIALDDLLFLRLLQKELNDCPNGAQRHIIRFYDPEAFQRCARHLSNSKNHFPGVRRLNVIHALCCSLRSVQRFSQFSRHIGLEEDVRVHVPFPVLPPFFVDDDQEGTYPLKKLPWGIRRIKAPLVWKESKGRGVNIAVIDTGVDFSHPDLQKNLENGVNILYRKHPPVDDNGHGTHIAGTIAASSASGGLTGIAPRAVIHPVKAFDYSGSALVSDIILGIEWCIQNRIDIINLSFGMTNQSPSLRDAIHRAYRRGIILVASSGNGGKKDHVDYPARFSYTIAVGATSQDKKIAPFSNRGPQIDIYAPGDKIISTWPGGKYKKISGTSMATAHVSGVIALLMGIRKNLSVKTLKQILKKTANPLQAGKREGKGEIDALRAVKHLKRRSHTLRR